MNDEQLSALIDDELPAEATREAVSQLLTEPRARATWGRYHLLGDALRASAEHTGVSRSPLQPANVVPFPQTRAAAQPARRLLSRRGLSIAAAAAVAAVALLVSAPSPDSPANSIALKSSNELKPMPLPVSERVASGTEIISEPFAPSTVSQTRMIKEDEAQKRMSIYLINFNEQRARQRAPGTHPYVHIIGYDTP
jgi:sigma-E factor negative regulatory protein RseA